MYCQSRLSDRPWLRGRPMLSTLVYWVSKRSTVPGAVMGKTALMLQVVAQPHVEVVADRDAEPGQRVRRAGDDAVAHVLVVGAPRVVVVELVAQAPLELAVEELHDVAEAHHVVGPVAVLLGRDGPLVEELLGLDARLQQREVPGVQEQGQAGHDGVALDEGVLPSWK